MINGCEVKTESGKKKREGEKVGHFWVVWCLMLNSDVLSHASFVDLGQRFSVHCLETETTCMMHQGVDADVIFSNDKSWMICLLQLAFSYISLLMILIYVKTMIEFLLIINSDLTRKLNFRSCSMSCTTFRTDLWANHVILLDNKK